MYPSDKKDDDFNFKRVLQCFLPLAMYPFGLKGCKKINFLINAPFGRFSLAMYPSDRFFLKAERVRALWRGAAASGRVRRAKGTSLRTLSSNPFAHILLGGNIFLSRRTFWSF